MGGGAHHRNRQVAWVAVSAVLCEALALLLRDVPLKGDQDVLQVGGQRAMRQAGSSKVRVVVGKEKGLVCRGRESNPRGQEIRAHAAGLAKTFCVFVWSGSKIRLPSWVYPVEVLQPFLGSKDE